jgi:hypothetical protein
MQGFSRVLLIMAHKSKGVLHAKRDPDPRIALLDLGYPQVGMHAVPKGWSEVQCNAIFQRILQTGPQHPLVIPNTELALLHFRTP